MGQQVSDLPATNSNFSKDTFVWPEEALQQKLSGKKMPTRAIKQKLLSAFVLILYIAPIMIAATLIEPHFKNELMKKAVSICVFFFGGLSIVMVFSTAPSLVANLYQQRRLKQAESLCRLYLFLVGNFSPYSYETALMYGLLAEVLKADARFDEAEKVIRLGIEACVVNENLTASSTLEDIPDNYKKLAQQSLALAMPTKGMLYETFGSILRDKKMYKQALEAGKRSVTTIEDKLRQAQTIPRDTTRIGMLSPDIIKPMKLALASTQYELALTYLAENNYEQALPLLKSARKIREEHQSTPYYMANVLSALGRVYISTNETEKALKCAQEALALLENAKLPVEHLARARALDIMSRASSSKGKLEDSKRLGIEAKEIRKRWLAPADPERAASSLD
jgi:tetratricopeptide (TPR) repeat protein